VEVNVPVDGSYNSALERYSLPLYPPAIRTFPLGRSVIVQLPLVVDIDPAALHVAAPPPADKMYRRRIKNRDILIIAELFTYITTP
jgi:hypothetical protein